MSFKFVVLFSITSLFVACSNHESIVSSAKVSTATDQKSVPGHLYALPKGYVLLTIERKAAKAKEDTKTETKTTREKETRTTKKTTEDQSKENTTEGTERPEKTRTTTSSGATTNKAATETRRETTTNAVETTSTVTRLELTVTPKQPLLVPDPKHIYRMEYENDPNVSENVKIVTDEKGLLSEIHVRSDDSVPSAVRSLADLVISASTGDFTPRSPRLAPQTLDAPQNGTNRGPFRVDAAFDPTTDSTTLMSLNKYLKGYDVTITTRKTFNENVGSTKESGRIYYRFLIPWEITVTDKTLNRRATVVVLLPNDGPIAGIDLKRLSLVRNTAKLGFTKGVLTSTHFDDPSQISVAVIMAADVLKAAVAIPAAVFQFTLKTENDIGKLTAQKNLLELQRDIADTQLQLREKEEALKKAEAAP